MAIYINDREQAYIPNETVKQLLERLSLGEAKGYAVAIEDEVIARSSWEHFCIEDGRRILLIQATQGG
jgi:sulfur carrier protein